MSIAVTSSYQNIALMHHHSGCKKVYLCVYSSGGCSQFLCIVLIQYGQDQHLDHRLHCAELGQLCIKHKYNYYSNTVCKALLYILDASFTNWRVSQLSAHHLGITWTPAVVTNSSPHSSWAQLYSTLQVTITTRDPYSSLHCTIGCNQVQQW